jgi:hypothetical protein
VGEFAWPAVARAYAALFDEIVDAKTGAQR